MNHPYPKGTFVTLNVDDVFEYNGRVFDAVGSEDPNRNFLETGWYLILIPEAEEDARIWEAPPGAVTAWPSG